MKISVAVFVLLLALQLPIFGLRTPSRSRQFNAKHATRPAANPAASAKRKLPVPLTREQRLAIGQSSRRPHSGRRFDSSNNTATTSVGLVTAPLIPLGG